MCDADARDADVRAEAAVAEAARQQGGESAAAKAEAAVLCTARESDRQQTFARKAEAQIAPNGRLLDVEHHKDPVESCLVRWYAKSVFAIAGSTSSVPFVALSAKASATALGRELNASSLGAYVSLMPISTKRPVAGDDLHDLPTSQIRADVGFRDQRAAACATAIGRAASVSVVASLKDSVAIDDSLS